MSAAETLEIVDGAVVDDVSPAAASTAVVRRERTSEVIRPLDTEQLVSSFGEYQALLPRLLDQGDWQDAGRGKSFVKKSGWRKIATAFDLDVQIVRSHVDRDHDGTPLRAEVIARAIAPSGRSMDGDGYCAVEEERFSGPRGSKSKLENDLRATAATRAKNRAIADLVGMGAVSAEEVSAGPVATSQPPAWAERATDAERAELWQSWDALMAAMGADPAQAEMAKAAAGRSFEGVVPRGFARAVSGIARAVLMAPTPAVGRATKEEYQHVAQARQALGFDDDRAFGALLDKAGLPAGDTIRDRMVAATRAQVAAVRGLLDEIAARDGEEVDGDVVPPAEANGQVAA